MHVFCPSAVFWKILKRLTVSARSDLSQLQLRHISCRWCVDGKEKQSAVMFIRRSFNVRHTGDLSSFFGLRISRNVCGRKCSRALPPCPRSRRGTWERPTRSWQGISASLNLQLDDVRWIFDKVLQNKLELSYGFGLQLCRSYAENYLAAFQPHNEKNISRGWSRSGAAATCAAEISSTFFSTRLSFSLFVLPNVDRLFSPVQLSVPR